MNFQKSLLVGRVGESIIADYFKNKGYSVLPVYEIEKHSGKGPQLFSKYENLVAPDAIVFKGGNAFWIEAKHKTAFSWYRKKQIWTTGIDKRHWLDYCKVSDLSPWPVWLMFLHKGGTAKDSPNSESGLFGQNLAVLKSCIDHQSDKYGPSGMVYWNKDSLKKIAEYETLMHRLN